MSNLLFSQENSWHSESGHVLLCFLFALPFVHVFILHKTFCIKATSFTFDSRFSLVFSEHFRKSLGTLSLVFANFYF